MLVNIAEMREKNNKNDISGEQENYSKPNYFAENSRKENKIWAILLVRYSGQFLKWTIEKLHQIDQKSRKLMMINKGLHSRDDAYWLHASREEWRRELTSIASVHRYNDKKSA